MMKKIITLTLLILSFAANAQEQEISVCEKELNTGVAKPLPVDRVWNEDGNSYNYGVIRKKTIEYAIKGQSYPETYRLYKYEKYGYYAVQSEYKVEGETTFFYNNLTDAVRALFVWQRCRVVLQKGKVKLE